LQTPNEAAGSGRGGSREQKRWLAPGAPLLAGAKRPRRSPKRGPQQKMRERRRRQQRAKRGRWRPPGRDCRPGAGPAALPAP